MHWFDTFMWGWVHFYADLLTIIGLIGLGACIVHYIIAFGDWIERKAAQYEDRH